MLQFLVLFISYTGFVFYYCIAHALLHVVWMNCIHLSMVLVIISIQCHKILHENFIWFRKHPPFEHKKRKELSNQSTLGIQMIKSHMCRNASSIFFKPEPESILFRVIDFSIYHLSITDVTLIVAGASDHFIFVCDSMCLASGFYAV